MGDQREKGKRKGRNKQTNKQKRQDITKSNKKIRGFEAQFLKYQGKFLYF